MLGVGKLEEIVLENMKVSHQTDIHHSDSNV